MIFWAPAARGLLTDDRIPEAAPPLTQEILIPWAGYALPLQYISNDISFGTIQTGVCMKCLHLFLVERESEGEKVEGKTPPTTCCELIHTEFDHKLLLKNNNIRICTPGG